ncbi:FolB domain-containing protein [Blochmannia endosymbiont of Colobopsis nipponica]|uniref:FolB domain-containing protein n=1 Tax=Blochmannia endosymbiont of Colobopsis nipponica TaxID=2681987 RepID=UPI001780E691|nr:dihydroneopterin aldolase [Blochmannia endosymbiont of Colobopsis nipponica]QOI10789.1 FolB domain-containing protein [Blochmannia endosymbiont of Colobopsis nipponica]
MDIIFIEQLIVMGVIGLCDWEQQQLQRLVFDLKLGYFQDLRFNFSNNELNYLDYSDIVNTVIAIVQTDKFSLLEQVAEKIATQLMIKFNIKWIQIKVSKPRAIPQAGNVSVIIERGERK